MVEIQSAFQLDTHCSLVEIQSAIQLDTHCAVVEIQSALQLATHCSVVEIQSALQLATHCSVVEIPLAPQLATHCSVVEKQISTPFGFPLATERENLTGLKSRKIVWFHVLFLKETGLNRAYPNALSLTGDSIICIKCVSLWIVIRFDQMYS